MKRPLWLLFLLAALAPWTLSSCSSYGQSTTAGASVTYDDYRDPSMSLFYDELEPYGRWFTYGSYGWCWTPYDVSAGWRPYYDGHWASSDLGWTWVSNESWGWAPYHYGRWLFDADYGWVWVPDTVWGPAWVAWRYDDDYIGWAPLPPGTDWRAGVQVTWTSGNFDRQIDPYAWCFVPSRSILDGSLATRVLPESRNAYLVTRTTFSVRYEDQSGRPANLGLDPAFAERRVGRRIPRERITDVDRPGRRGGMSFYRPQVRPEPRHAPVAEPEVRRDPVVDQRVQAQRDAEQRRIENYYEQQRREMEARHRQEEMQRSAPDNADEAMRRQRQEEERQQLEQAKERERRVIESRYQKNLYKPDKAAKRGNGNRDRDRGRGRGGANQ